MELTELARKEDGKVDLALEERFFAIFVAAARLDADSPERRHVKAANLLLLTRKKEDTVETTVPRLMQKIHADPEGLETFQKELEPYVE